MQLAFARTATMDHLTQRLRFSAHVLHGIACRVRVDAGMMNEAALSDTDIPVPSGTLPQR